MNPGSTPAASPLSRRDFLRTSMAAAAATVAGGCASSATSRTDRAATTAPRAAVIHVDPKPLPLRVGLIGCGGRGTGAALDCVMAAPDITVVAMGDLFADRLASSRSYLAEKLGPAFVATDETCFIGFDAYRGVLAADIDLVLLATPPHFRPLHLAAAIEAGKHVFMEKPVAVDPVGVRKVLAAAARAEERGLAIVAGTQRRHQPSYVETLQRIHAGAIGELVAGQCYWNQGGLWNFARQPEWSDMEWQCRNWLYFTWLSGDHIVEQHMHNLDVMNWAMGGPPVKALGTGGRQCRTSPEYGNVYDHFAVEYEYANGARVLSMCRQIDGTSTRVSERLVGTAGTADPSGEIFGPRAYRFEDADPPVNPYVQEHADLIASIRRGAPLNEGRQVAESTLTAILGRMSAYTGRELSWEWVLNSSQLDLTPPHYEFAELPVEEIAHPGQTKLL
ncbi:MAG: Gfo/Idh/MocA family oxidoreductase [Phycisphaerales bacterium]|nr:Gfo/Idh/MocA family oxidoreductase [Phycisphaerales bacterium]